MWKKWKGWLAILNVQIQLKGTTQMLSFSTVSTEAMKWSKSLTSHKITTCLCVMPAAFQSSFKTTISFDSFINAISKQGEQHHFRDEEMDTEQVSPKAAQLTCECRKNTAPSAMPSLWRQTVELWASSSQASKFLAQDWHTVSSGCLTHLCYPSVRSNIWWMDGWTMNGWIIMNGGKERQNWRKPWLILQF